MTRGETLYVVLHKDKDSTWSVVSTGSEMPSELTADAVVIRGRVAVARDPIYVLLNRESREKWKADSLVVGGERPFGKLKRGQAVARASGRRDYVDFGMESYYIPDRERKRVVKDIRDHPDEISARIRIDREGRATLRGFRVQNRVYEF